MPRTLRTYPPLPHIFLRGASGWCGQWHASCLWAPRQSAPARACSAMPTRSRLRPDHCAPNSAWMHGTPACPRTHASARACAMRSAHSANTLLRALRHSLCCRLAPRRFAAVKSHRAGRPFVSARHTEVAAQYNMALHSTRCGFTSGHLYSHADAAHDTEARARCSVCVRAASMAGMRAHPPRLPSGTSHCGLTPVRPSRAVVQ